MNDKNLQEKATSVKWNTKSKLLTERFYNCIVIVELDKIAVQYKNLQETETAVTRNKKSKQSRERVRKSLHMH